jgi:hypothetical protein
MQTRNLGIGMMVIGLIMMIYTGFTFITTKNVVDIGPVQINQHEKHPIHWSPIAGTVLLVGGIALFASGKKRR